MMYRRRIIDSCMDIIRNTGVSESVYMTTASVNDLMDKPLILVELKNETPDNAIVVEE